MEQRRRFHVGGEFAALGAFRITIKNKAAGVETLEQHHAHIGQAIGIRRGERHRIRVVRFGLFGLGKPGGKERERVFSFGKVTHD